MIESWNDVPGYEGLYEVSNWGRVRRNGKILKTLKDRKGYLHVVLSKNGTRKIVRVHRLVAQTFIPNSQNLPQVNHKDEDKTNNAVDNLEWCDNKYNSNYGTRNERLSKPVLQYDLLGNFIREWPSMKKVEEELGIYQGSISHCCLGHRNSAGSYLWRFKN